MLLNLWNDLRYAARRLAASPGFMAAAVVTIALGVGINTALFSVLNGIVLRDLPAPDPHELVSIQLSRELPGFPGRPLRRFSGAEYREYRDATETLSGILAYSGGTIVTLGGDAPQEVVGTLVSCNYFEVLQYAPMLGPGLSNDCDADGATPTVVLGHDLWSKAFGADPGIVGREVQLNRQAFVVAGIAPEGMRGLFVAPMQFFAPLSAQSILDPFPGRTAGGDYSSLMLLGRLADGASLEQARAELRVIAARIDEAQGSFATTLAVDRAKPLSDAEDRGATLAVGAVVMTAFGLVLLIACANVANLLLARAAGRAREIAVRLSLGASRGRIVQQLLAESLLLAAAGGVLGSVLALWSVQGLVFLAIDALPPQAPEVDPIALIGAIFVVVGIAFAAGTLPARRAARVDPTRTLHYE